MNKSFLIPANSKKSMLILSVFRPIDAIIFGTGILVSFMLMMFLNMNEFWVAIFAISPGLITGFLVLPVPNYHNILTVIINAWVFYTTRQKYVWRGWCFEHGEEGKR